MRHNHSMEAHNPLDHPVPSATATTFAAGRGTLLWASRWCQGGSRSIDRPLLMLLLILLLARLLCSQLCQQLSRRLCRVAMPIELAHATATTSRSAGTTVWTVTKTALTCGFRRSNGFDMYAEHIVLLSDNTCRIRFHLCKETRGGQLQHRQTDSLLKNITTRLNDVLAEKFEENQE